MKVKIEKCSVHFERMELRTFPLQLRREANENPLKEK